MVDAINIKIVEYFNSIEDYLVQVIFISTIIRHPVNCFPIVILFNNPLMFLGHPDWIAFLQAVWYHFSDQKNHP